METGNTIINRVLQCLNMIDEMPEGEREALAQEYWDFVDRRRADREGSKDRPQARRSLVERFESFWEGRLTRFQEEPRHRKWTGENHAVQRSGEIIRAGVPAGSFFAPSHLCGKRPGETDKKNG